MAIYRTYECPDCEGVFRHLHHPNDEPPPSHCPLCGAQVSGQKKERKKRLKKADWVRLPGVKPPPYHKAVGRKSVDKLYRQMENAAETRMEDAAEMLGVDKRTLSDMKMTNMKDNLREGDLSFASSAAPSDATKLTGGAVNVEGVQVGQMAFQDRNNAAEYAKTVGQGPHPFAGNKMREMVTSNHNSRAHSVVSRGRMNKG